MTEELFGEIDIDELEDRLAAGAFLVDVRETDEYLSGHVPGAVSVPLSELVQRAEECRDPRGNGTLMICKVGGRSASACAHLAGLGFEVTNVAGGTMAWIMSGRDVVEGSSPR